jgi:hypothetical protein
LNTDLNANLASMTLDQHCDNAVTLSVSLAPAAVSSVAADFFGSRNGEQRGLAAPGGL